MAILRRVGYFYFHMPEAVCFAGMSGSFFASRQHMNSAFEKVGTKHIATVLLCKYAQLKRVKGEKWRFK
jgi:hypothetical protein